MMALTSLAFRLDARMDNGTASAVLPPAPAAPAQWSVYFWGGLLFVLLHFAFLLCFFSPAVSTPDAHSYFTQARTLAAGGVAYVVPESPVQYVGPHYGRSASGRYYCTHAPGLGLLMAVPYRLLGPQAALWVNPILCSLGLAGFFLLCRLWCGERWALFATVLMAANPYLNEHAHFGDSHEAVAFLLIWSLYALALLSRRPSIGLGLAAGLLAGMIPVTRYAEAVYLPAMAWYALSRRREDRADRPALWAAAAGAAVPLLLLCLRNQAAYGAFWRTGYAATGEQAAFAPLYFMRNSPAFLAMLLCEGAGPTFALGALALVRMLRRAGARRRGLLLAGIAVPSTLIYMSYYWPPDPQSMRFLIPTFFLYAMASVWLLRSLARRSARAVRIAAGFLLALHVAWGLPRALRSMSMLQMQDRALEGAGEFVQDAVPAGDLLIAPESVLQFLDGLGSWRLVDEGLLNGSSMPPAPPFGLGMGMGMGMGGLPGSSARGGGSPYGEIDPMEAGMAPVPAETPLPTAASLRAGPRRRMPGPGLRPAPPRRAIGADAPGRMRPRDPYPGLSGEERLKAFRADVFAWAGGRKVYWLMSHSLLEARQAALPPGDRLAVRARMRAGKGLGMGALRSKGEAGPRAESGPVEGGGSRGEEDIGQSRPVLVEWTRGED